MQYNKTQKDNNPEGGVSMKTKKITVLIIWSGVHINIIANMEKEL